MILPARWLLEYLGSSSQQTKSAMSSRSRLAGVGIVVLLPQESSGTIVIVVLWYYCVSSVPNCISNIWYLLGSKLLSSGISIWFRHRRDLPCRRGAVWQVL